MVVLQFIHSLGNGGAEKFAVELSNEFAKIHDVKLCSIKPIEDWMLPPKKISKKVKLIELKISKKSHYVYFLKIFQLIKKVQPRVVHVHSSFLVFYIYIISIFYRNKIFLQTIHSTLTPGYEKLFKFLQKIRFLNKYFINVCISKSIFEQYSTAFPKLRFVHVDNGVENCSTTDKFTIIKNEIERIKKNTDTKVFTAIGNYSSLKNFIMLAEVFNELESIGLNAILLLIGSAISGNMRNYDKVTEVKGDNTSQLGTKDNVADYLYCSDALIVSSTKEGMPLVVLEALSCGLPIISTPAGGVIDIIDNGLNGIIANGFDKVDLIKAILTFISLPENQKKQIKENNINKYHEKYTMEICAKRYLEQVYQIN